ncbi:multidrug effflux MFS transporter [Psychrobium sp. 1_MG-2023]|uniref:multidrug effflux MFS transporter n=1 Tax=Psychrobium sp. 1_MG-2023 TaxID=3062624 RepID=UPI000C339731|nr:multidrug effflux MFS transporter [Psychrobium sp. 1_MG-2023]MDP2562771.1 multidrug effflux MFS transporter [Psychrobium sp. 1_MG-2023]PKF57695.1 Bcr/CflA family drug resistance efflux transporter [Alteromonadales bacterium alter-6D02]
MNVSKTLIALMITLVLFSPLAIDIYLPALPLISEEFAISNAKAQDTITWFMIAMGLGQLLAGPLADRFGRRPIAIAGIIIYGLSSLLAWWAAQIELLLAARLIQGIGACATSVAAFATVRDSFGPERSGRMISYLNGAICFIPALAPLLGAWLTIQFGWRSNFSFMALFALVVLFFIVRFFEETKPSNTVSHAKLINREQYISVLREPTFIFHATLCLLAMAVILAYVTSAPVYLITQLGLSMEQFTFWFSINAVLNIAASLLAPRYMDKFGSFFALNTGLIVLVLGGFAMLLLSGFNQPWAFMLPIFFSSVGFALVLGSSAGKALAPFGDRAGVAAALLGLFQMTGAGLLVGLMQRIDISDSVLLSVQMLLLAPGLVLLNLSYGKRWHQHS